MEEQHVSEGAVRQSGAEDRNVVLDESIHGFSILMNLSDYCQRDD